MRNLIKHLLPKKQPTTLSIEEAAALLHTSPEALKAFEHAYQIAQEQTHSDDLMQTSSQDIKKQRPVQDICPQELIDRIVTELLANTAVWSWDGTTISDNSQSLTQTTPLVSVEEVNSLPLDIRPQATGFLKATQVDHASYKTVLSVYDMMQKEKNMQKKQTLYHMFRQGLDILDLDPVLYEILGMNRNAMGYWLPNILPAVQKTNTFRVPKTHIIKVPLPILQLSRMEFEGINRTTLNILDDWLFQLCDLDESKDYFVKTGTYSSKYNFRNAKVTGAKEVRETAEYLLFLSNQAVHMAGPLTNVSRYGVSTTNEWVVREYIADTENNPCIYNGMPLHTEYRAFVDFDTKEILGIHPYWDKDIMMERFTGYEDSKDPVMVHDAVIYKMHENTLYQRYEENKSLVLKKLETLLQENIDLTGQWSIDIMQNGDDFWLIDMAVAENSAFYKETVPLELRRPVPENWLPDFSQK